MKKYADMTLAERKVIYKELLSEYESFCKRGLTLDLSRGKPNSSQLDISQGLLSVALDNPYSEGGVDCRNYGVLDGLPEAKRFFADVFGFNAEDVIVCGNSSLQLMYDSLSRAMLFGVYGSARPWVQEKGLKWLCVTPGYDRHFAITEKLGFELISVPMTKSGPDMDIVEELVKDPAVKGIWCVPKYSNPTGNTYSDETVTRLAKMECAAPDFRIMWDNAYAVHDFDKAGDILLDIFAEAERYGHKDRIFAYASTSKVTLPGAGVAVMAMSENNRKQIIPYLGVQTIGYDKINQLRHLRYFGTPEALRAHMLKLGELIGAKFRLTLDALESLRGLGIASWTVPNGGYFISLDVLPGTAKRVFGLMKKAGVTLTSAGATHPYGVDPLDKNLRIAPTYPSDNELTLASGILALSVKIAALESLGV